MNAYKYIRRETEENGGCVDILIIRNLNVQLF